MTTAAKLALSAAVAAAIGTLLPMSAADAQTPTTTPATRDAAAGEVDLPVRAVTLFSSGVGYFEHAGTVDGDADTQLRFKADQIDDLLKSLVLQDLDGGTVAAVTYPSSEPLARQLGSFQIDLGGDTSLVGLLGQLRGAKLTLRTGDVDPIEGTVVSVDTRTVAEGDGGGGGATVEKAFVTLFTGGGLKSVPIDSVVDFEIEDARLRQEMARALEALAKARDKDKKAVGFNFSGEGERRVRLGYVVESPVWKTSYRLLLGDTAEDDTNLQGWAIVENQTDNDWQNVQLSLVSGRPISFEMELSQPLYVQRPTVEIPRYASLTPKAYADGVEQELNDEMAEAAPAAPALRRAARGQGGGGFGGGGGAGGAPTAGYAAEAMDMYSSVQSVASATDLGELFEYTISSVSLPRQSSAMIPVVTDEVSAEKVSLYDPQQLSDHPLNAVILDNTTGKHLLAGPVTVFEAGGYAGDSQVRDTPPGEKRLLTYGIDLKIDARIEPGQTRTELITGSISRGVLTLKRRIRTAYTYVFDNETDAARTVVVEHAYDRGYDLIDTPEPYETTDQVRRFKVSAEPGVTRFTVTSETITDERRQLVQQNISADELIALSRGEALPVEVREALAKAAELRRAVDQSAERLAATTRELESIAQEQQRLRQNMETVDSSSSYYKRLLTKLDEQETRIEQLQSTEADLRAELERRQSEYRDYLAKLEV